MWASFVLFKMITFRLRILTQTSTMTELNIKRLVQSIGVANFLDYFHVFRYMAKHDIKKEFEDTQEDWAESSKETISSTAKRIFKAGKEKEALEYICAEVQRIDDFHKEMAFRLLKKLDKFEDY